MRCSVNTEWMSKEGTELRQRQWERRLGAGRGYEGARDGWANGRLLEWKYWEEILGCSAVVSTLQ